MSWWGKLRASRTRGLWAVWAITPWTRVSGTGNTSAQMQHSATPPPYGEACQIRQQSDRSDILDHLGGHAGASASLLDPGASAEGSIQHLGSSWGHRKRLHFRGKRGGHGRMLRKEGAQTLKHTRFRQHPRITKKDSILGGGLTHESKVSSVIKE